MTNPNDSAFPTVRREEVYSESKQSSDGSFEQSKTFGDVWTGGLTKREYFAARAMQGILANLPTYEKGKYIREGVQVTPSATLLAIDLADALIADLNK